MDNWILRPTWITLIVSILYINAFTQEVQSQNSNRRKLPTVIITREHLRQRPVHYGSPGDTAAEFIVSAGLDNSKTAVRIRKLGQTPTDSTQLQNPEYTKTVSTSAREPNRQHPASYHPDLRYRTPNYNAVSQNQPVRNPQILQRRQDVRDNRQPYIPDVLNIPSQQYVPPIFVPNYQQHTFNNPSFHRPIVAVRVKSDGTREKINIPAHSQDRRNYFNQQGSQISNGQSLNHKIFTVESPVLVRKGPEKQNPTSTTTNPDYETPNIVKNQEKGLLPKENSENGNDQQINTKFRQNDPNKNVVVETPPLELSAKSNDIKNQLIRRPSIVLTDQITVNEVRPQTNRPRYGPRSLQHDEDKVNARRRKRDAYDSESLGHSAHDDAVDPEDLENFQDQNVDHFKNAAPTDEEIMAKNVQSWKEFGTRTRRKGRNRKLRNSKRLRFQEQTPVTPISNVSLDYQTSTQSSTIKNVKSDSLKQSFHESLDGDVMSFSDFITSPIAEKIRVERQFMFRNMSDNLEKEAQTRNRNQYNYETFLQNSSLLRDIIATRLLHSLINIDNSSSNSSDISISEEQSTARSSPERLASAEQRQFGIVVSPYESHESSHSKSSMPIIRILRGKVVPLPELPRELIPLILGRFKHSYSSEPTFDDPQLTENMIDNAILSLLQNEEVVNAPSRYHEYKRHPINMQRVNKKSPSTNYVGSLKNSEPMTKPSYSFKPAEWAVGPRCDRLTEEICLDDSDYPSSAIMSSIYKDKGKFDLMYAEVKVRESQVEGLSRQQEQAYTLEHYYGPYAQASSSNHEYGQNGGFVCPSEVHYGRPHRAKNRQGEWKVVVNVGEYTQTLRMEKCLASGNPCKYVVSHMQSTCSQVFSYHRLLVFNKELGLHIDLFRVPSACTCHLRSIQGGYTAKYSAPIPFVQRPNPYEEFGGHVESAPPPQISADGPANNEEKKKNSFSSTLWSILGGGQQASTLAQQPQFLDEVQKQIGWTQQLKQYPQFMKQISPNQVLKQLLEDDEEEEQGVRRYRIRNKSSPDVMSYGDFASHHVPVAVPLPPPPPPPKIIPRRPVVSASTPQQHLFGMPSDIRKKVMTVTSPPAEKAVFSLTQQPRKNVIRIAPGDQTNHKMVGSSPYEITAYKIFPGMYSPTSGEDSQVPEDSFVPIAPQFSENASSGDGLRAVLKPMPRPEGSERVAVEEEDLIAVEKSEDGDIHTFKLKTVEDNGDSEPSVEVDGSKINFSYHPILEYLNFSH
ncbi:uncharacterized protein [Parasteatoda tepidariorum]|uniref:uncharacterized protein n=1 Tax=Parasteatoda tepidariorum TaxID=114398 RepID=UPI00077F9473|nr:uncharacterized protein LOC107436135 [Parasteatoda tepidariorum]